MKPKKIFLNLLESITLCLLLATLIAFYSMILWFAVLHPNENTDPKAAFIFGTIFLGSSIIVCTVAIVRGCFGYWMLTDHSIFIKRLFRKRLEIQFSEIERVEKKEIRSVDIYSGRAEGYIIYSKDKTIAIPFFSAKKKKELKDLEQIITPYFEKE